MTQHNPNKKKCSRTICNCGTDDCFNCNCPAPKEETPSWEDCMEISKQSEESSCVCGYEKARSKKCKFCPRKEKKCCEKCIKHPKSALASADQEQMLAVAKAREEGKDRGWELGIKQCLEPVEKAVAQAKREMLERLVVDIEKRKFLPKIAWGVGANEALDIISSLLTFKLEELNGS